MGRNDRRPAPGRWVVPDTCRRTPAGPRPAPEYAIALLGGTFDPPHRAVRQAAIPPHKGPSVLAPARHRHRMVRLAVGKSRGLAVSALEMRRPGPSYTIDTVRDFRRRFPGHALYFIVGADTVRDIPNWHRWRDLIRKVRFIAVSRPGFRLAPLKGYADRFVLLACRGYRTSSASLRVRLARGRSTPELSPAVAAYIRRHGLYRPGATA